MIRWIFTGTADKRDLLLYICKVMASSGRRVLLVDATEAGKYRYCIGGITESLDITEFNGFDVARAGAPALVDADENYDFCLYDVNLVANTNEWIWNCAERIVWVSSYDRYEIVHSFDFFSKLFTTWPHLQRMQVLPVFTRTMDSYVTEPYVMSFMEPLPIDWMITDIRIPWDENNAVVQVENEHAQTLRMHRITRTYKRAITQLISQLAGWEFKTVRKAFRIAERRRA